MEDDTESPPPCNFFSNRAKFNPRKNAEELRAAVELVNKIEEENSKITKVVRTAFSSPSNKGRKKGKKKLRIQTVDDREEITDDSFSEALLSAASKRRLKKLREEQELEFKRIEAENEKVLSAVDENSNLYVETVNQTVEDFEKVVALTIMYMSKILRLKCYENDKFSGIFPKIAELLSLEATEFLLCFNAQNITEDDTPKSLNITDHDILDCIPYKADNTGNAFKIKFQSNDTKKKDRYVDSCKGKAGRYYEAIC